MVDISKVKYSVSVIGDDGTQYNIKNYIQSLGWEESSKEISMRLTFKARNDDTSKGQLSSLVKPGSLIVVTASDGGSFNGEVARGYAEKWNPQDRSSASDLSCICYDEMYRLQRSQDNLYLPDGTGTKSAIQKLLDEWEVPIGEYKGPNATHGKLTFKNKYLSDIILELLDDAVKKGGEKCIIRATCCGHHWLRPELHHRQGRQPLEDSAEAIWRWFAVEENLRCQQGRYRVCRQEVRQKEQRQRQMDLSRCFVDYSVGGPKW